MVESVSWMIFMADAVASVPKIHMRLPSSVEWKCWGAGRWCPLLKPYRRAMCCVLVPTGHSRWLSPLARNCLPCIPAPARLWARWAAGPRPGEGALQAVISASGQHLSKTIASHQTGPTYLPSHQPARNPPPGQPASPAIDSITRLAGPEQRNALPAHRPAANWSPLALSVRRCLAAAAPVASISLRQPPPIELRSPIQWNPTDNRNDTSQVTAWHHNFSFLSTIQNTSQSSRLTEVLWPAPPLASLSRTCRPALAATACYCLPSTAQLDRLLIPHS